MQANFVPTAPGEDAPANIAIVLAVLFTKPSAFSRTGPLSKRISRVASATAFKFIGHIDADYKNYNDNKPNNEGNSWARHATLQID